MIHHARQQRPTLGSPGAGIARPVAGTQTQPDALEHRRNAPPPRRGILLQDLPTGGQSDCEVLALCTTTMVQKVSLVGDAISGGTFTLSFQLPNQSKQTTPALPYNATAAQVQTALQALPAIGPNNVTVTLGKLPAFPAQPASGSVPAVPAIPAEFPGLWLVEFVGPFANTSPPAPTTTAIPLLTATPSLQGGPATIVINNELWRDTGIVMKANAVIPVGTPTPMKAGAVVYCVMHPGLGYAVMGCEARQFSVTVF